MSTFCWSSNFGGGSHPLDSEEYIKKGKNLLKWKIPKIPTTKIYKSNPFTFFSDPLIKTKEETMPCENGSQAFRLIYDNPILASFQEKRFCTMLNMGMIQIGVKTLTTKISSNASIILCVFDTRNDNFEDSILGLVEAKLSDGPMFFNIFPNITMSLFHPKLCESLVLIAMVQGFEQLPQGTSPISLMWRTCYKLQGSAFPTALIESPQGKTVFFQTDFENSKVAVQKVSEWDEVVCKVRNNIMKH
uniref:Polyprotein n=1 Tax=Cucumis melo TaxID=3656 RepID=A0A9I9DAE0_CUCME